LVQESREFLSPCCKTIAPPPPPIHPQYLPNLCSRICPTAHSASFSITNKAMAVAYHVQPLQCRPAAICIASLHQCILTFEIIHPFKMQGGQLSQSLTIKLVSDLDIIQIAQDSSLSSSSSSAGWCTQLVRAHCGRQKLN
jgi:hypothetical protein